MRGRRSLWRMLDYLEAIEPGENVSLAEGVKNFCLRNSGKGILVLITDLMDKTGYEAALRILRGPGDGRLRDPRALARKNSTRTCKGDLRLVDCEDGDVAEITVSRPLLERYKRTLAAFVDGARDFCTRRGMIYLLASNEVPVEQSGHQLPSPAGVGAMSCGRTSSSTCSARWQWAILLAVPPAIVALYFLKLKRQPLEVPSTYLWHRAIEDLHVNSIWQRLRRSILLLLQLLLVLLLMLAVLRPGWRGATLQGDRFIFLIDNSASMKATDVEPDSAGRGEAPCHAR